MLKFTDAGAVSLRVRLDEEGDEAVKVCFEVADTGAGIAPDALQLLFPAFEQADAGVTRTHGGTGLGLVITKRLAQMMGGDAGADSTAGVGSRSGSRFG